MENADADIDTRSPSIIKVRPLKVLYVAGPGDAIGAHRNWVRGEHDPTEVSITFSSQIEQACRDNDAELYIIDYPATSALLQDGPITIEHRPKPFPGAHGFLYYFRELLYGFSLLSTAVRFRADVAVLDSGCTLFFLQGMFGLFRIKVVPVLHNSLWPTGYRPVSLVPRIVMGLDRVFWRRTPYAAICVSPECERQLRELAGEVAYPVYQIRAQFRREYFADIPSPPVRKNPFHIMYIGRVTRSKGVFDILEMAERIEGRRPGGVRWEICGGGPDLEALRELHKEKRLGETVIIRGWTTLDDLLGVYARSHACIVPTRSSFTEGLAMTAAEAVLAGRPVITSPVVPALEVLRSAAVEARTDDVDSYVDQILKLIGDEGWYDGMVKACPILGEQFYDSGAGLTNVLSTILKSVAR